MRGRVVHSKFAKSQLSIWNKKDDRDSFAELNRDSFFGIVRTSICIFSRRPFQKSASPFFFFLLLLFLFSLVSPFPPRTRLISSASSFFFYPANPPPPNRIAVSLPREFRMGQQKKITHPLFPLFWRWTNGIALSAFKNFIGEFPSSCSKRKKKE